MVIEVLLLLLGLVILYKWLTYSDMLHTVKDKRVLVVGASEGIGEKIAYHYARLGANVVISARREEKLAEVLKECQARSPSVNTKHFAVAGDATKSDDVKKVIKETIEKLGGLDVLVLNHVRFVFGAAFEGTQEDLDGLDLDINVNFRSYVHLTSHALPELLANNGSIIVVNTLSGIIPTLYFSTVSATKAALMGFFHSLRSEFVERGQNVSITTCYLGSIGTDNNFNKRKTETSLVKRLIKPATPDDTALDIVKGGAKRQDEVFTPYFSSRPMPILYGMFPSLMTAMFRLAIRNLIANRK